MNHKSGLPMIAIYKCQQPKPSGLVVKLNALLFNRHNICLRLNGSVKTIFLKSYEAFYFCTNSLYYCWSNNFYVRTLIYKPNLCFQIYLTAIKNVDATLHCSIPGIFQNLGLPISALQQFSNICLPKSQLQLFWTFRHEELMRVAASFINFYISTFTSYSSKILRRNQARS